MWPFKDKVIEVSTEKIEKTFSKDQVESIINELAVNDDAAASVRQRMAAAISGGYDFADTLHNVYLDYGYPGSLSFSNYWNMFRRFGIAKNVVELPVDTCWISAPEIEGSDKFNSDFEKLIKQVKFWQRMKALDNRQRVGRYAGMFMRVRDNKKPDEPIEGKLPGMAALVEMVPLYESQLQVLTVEDNAMSDNYGQPTMYQFNGGAEGNRNDKTAASFNIHPSRIIPASEGADDGGIYGISSLEAPYNSLMDLRKIIGAGGEGFYKNAAKDIIFSSDPKTSANLDQKVVDGFNAQYDDFNKNRARRSFMALGLEASTLDSNLADPKEFFFNALYDVSAATKIPATIIIGQQTGRLASDEDSSQYLKMNQSRRENFLTDLIEDAIDWTIQWGIMPSSEYEVVWDDLLASSDSEKLENADKMATINEKSFKSGAGTVFEPELIKEVAGFEEEDLPEPDETVPPDGTIIDEGDE